MNGVCDTHGKDDKWVENFIRENMKGRDHLEDLVIDGRII